MSYVFGFDEITCMLHFFTTSSCCSLKGKKISYWELIFAFETLGSIIESQILLRRYFGWRLLGKFTEEAEAAIGIIF